MKRILNQYGLIIISALLALVFIGWLFGSKGLFDSFKPLKIKEYAPSLREDTKALQASVSAGAGKGYSVILPEDLFVGGTYTAESFVRPEENEDLSVKFHSGEDVSDNVFSPTRKGVYEITVDVTDKSGDITRISLGVAVNDRSKKVSWSADMFNISGSYIKGLSEKGKEYLVKTDGVLVVPRLSDGSLVISANAFLNNTDIKQVVFEEGSVSRISSMAFSGCTSLKNLSLPNGLVKINSYAFKGCTALSGVSVPSTVTSLDQGVFSGCSGLTNLVFNPENYTESVDYSVEKGPFDGAGAAGSGINLVMGRHAENVPDIFRNANIKSLDLGYGTKRFEDVTSLRFMTGLQEITAHAQNDAFYTVDGVLYNKDKTELLAFPMASNLASYRVVDGVQIIGKYAFYGQSSLKKVYMPSSVKTVSSYSFANKSGSLLIYFSSSSADVSFEANWKYSSNKVFTTFNSTL